MVGGFLQVYYGEMMFANVVVVSEVIFENELWRSAAIVHEFVVNVIVALLVDDLTIVVLGNDVVDVVAVMDADVAIVIETMLGVLDPYFPHYLSLDDPFPHY